MNGGEADSAFQPGFRFSRFDGLILVAGGSIAAGTALWLPLAGAVVAFVLGHFFLFCNVFRIARIPELIWATVFFGLATAAMCSTDPVRMWAIAFGASIALAAVLIALETRKPSYHGIGWRRFNPGLKDWWDRVRSSTS